MHPAAWIRSNLPGHCHYRCSSPSVLALLVKIFIGSGTHLWEEVRGCQSRQHFIDQMHHIFLEAHEFTSCLICKYRKPNKFKHDAEPGPELVRRKFPFGSAPEGDVLHRRSHPRRTSDTPLVYVDQIS